MVHGALQKNFGGDVNNWKNASVHRADQHLRGGVVLQAEFYFQAN